MAFTELTCRIRVKKVEDNESDGEKPEEATFLPLGEYPDVGTEIRVRWANEVMKHFEQSEKPHTSIRPWDFVAELDGSVQSLPMPGVEGDLIEGYPTHFQIPPSALHSLDHGEKVKRAEMFAMASLLYETMTGRKPLEGLTDDVVQHRFMNGEFPDDAAALPNTLFILSGWSAEFSHELTRRGTVHLFVDVPQALLTLFIVEAQEVTLFERSKNYVKAHPVLTGLQVVGTTVSVLSFFAVPILGAVGFTAAGPAAGSAAAAWQASMGAVKAGSLFSWCQSAAMGGWAVGGIQAAGVAGTALARVGDLPDLMETFRKGFRAQKRLE
ncbi:MAG: hypothetical protein Q9161_008769 [Pseudevernia consocians]